ncbi:MAG: RAMP superfamily CRISPR-associated protein [Candidatus Methanomethyliaceae archaeon]|nr:RAMP superfamily CRISPR-associated protein [Candidatus Methanomethyliaceae archaeon]MCX8170015.1 RAMP superfamily CRISPR-associated protein [Candidatus Methanomethyliaceae archaeon]MDW7971446.1 RAMP superfamily CRISPR-associated protein [Nitrososphaerota archaeon]
MIDFNVRLKTISLLCIGWSHPSIFGPDIPFIRELNSNGKMRIYIPASSFRGALRSSAIKLAENYGFKSCGEIRPELIEDRHNRMGGKCDVCDLFGEPMNISSLIVSNFEPIKDIKSLILTRIRLEDNSLKVSEEALFKVEYIPVGSEFLGNIKLINPTQKRAALLLIALAGLRIGRFGRGSNPIDIRIENTEKIEALLGDWYDLLNELKGWLWH